MSAPVDAVIVSGFLGAGKTTIINRLLADADGTRIAVLENEFGDVAIDDELLSGAVRVVALAGGCLCCTVQGELAAALAQLADRTDDFDLLVVEATGVADPRPVLAAFQAAEVRTRLRVRSLVTLVDAAHLHPLDEHLPEWRAQVRSAQALVLTKTDACDPRRTSRLRDRLRAINADAEIVDLAAAPGRALALLAGAGHGQMSESVGAPHDHDHGGHGFASVAVRVDGDVDLGRVRAWLDELGRRPGVELLRVKGVLAQPNDPRAVVLHGVFGTVSTQPGRRWGPVRRSRLVLIGRGLDEIRLRAEFAGSGASEARKARMAER